MVTQSPRQFIRVMMIELSMVNVWSAEVYIFNEEPNMYTGGNRICVQDSLYTCGR